jgi:hypothetical protein
MKKAGMVHLMVVAAIGVFTGGLAGDSSVVLQSDAPAQRYFEILVSPAKILRSVNPQSPILGFAYKNEIYPLVFAGTSWHKIAFKNDTGWIEASQGRIVSSSAVSTTEKIPAIIIIVLFSLCGLIVVVLGIIFIILSMKRQKFRRTSLQRNVLIISSVEKEIHYSLTEASTTLSKCFSEIGFKVSTARDLDHARILLVHFAPDVLVVDWQLERNIESTIQPLLSTKGSAESILVIFFNVPDSAEMYNKNIHPMMHFVGIVFSDRDIFKIVTPLIMEGKTSHTFKKSVQSSALEGEIGSGNLVEVMQFIEIGKKTGILYVSLRNPFGIISFEQGRITYAATRLAAGRAAVSDILNLKEGRFRFSIDKIYSKKNVNLSTLEVLMDWTKGKDEAHRH